MYFRQSFLMDMWKLLTSIGCWAVASSPTADGILRLQRQVLLLSALVWANVAPKCVALLPHTQIERKWCECVY